MEALRQWRRLNPWSLRARGRSFIYAGKGGGLLFRQPNACIHLFVTVCVIAAGIIFGISATEWCLCALSIGMVFAAEGFNTAIEALADKVSEGFDPLIGKAKDLAAGAVLLAVGAAVAVGLIIFIPYLIRVFA